MFAGHPPLLSFPFFPPSPLPSLVSRRAEAQINICWRRASRRTFDKEKWDASCERHKDD